MTEKERETHKSGIWMESGGDTQNHSRAPCKVGKGGKPTCALARTHKQAQSTHVTRATSGHLP